MVMVSLPSNRSNRVLTKTHPFPSNPVWYYVLSCFTMSKAIDSQLMIKFLWFVLYHRFLEGGWDKMLVGAEDRPLSVMSRGPLTTRERSCRSVCFPEP